MWETSPPHSSSYLCEQPVGGRHAGRDDVAQWIEEAALIVARAVEPRAPGQAGGGDVEHSPAKSRID